MKKIGHATESPVGSLQLTAKAPLETRVRRRQGKDQSKKTAKYGQTAADGYGMVAKEHSKLHAILGRAMEAPVIEGDTVPPDSAPPIPNIQESPPNPFASRHVQRQGRRRRRAAEEQGSDHEDQRRRRRRRRAAREEESDDERAPALGEGQLDDDVGLSHADAQEQTFAPHVPPACARPPLLPHPDELVETASLASVPMPPVAARLRLPSRVLLDGLLTAPQAEACLRAVAQHELRLPDGRRSGFFMGDGAGVGKGRQQAAVVVHNFLHGRRRALWLSVGADLVDDARRDLADLGAAGLVRCHSLRSFKLGRPIPAEDGVLFCTYALLVCSPAAPSAPPSQGDRRRKGAACSGRGETKGGGRGVLPPAPSGPPARLGLRPRLRAGTVCAPAPEPARAPGGADTRRRRHGRAPSTTPRRGSCSSRQEAGGRGGAGG